MAVDRSARAVILLSSGALGSQLALPVASSCRDRRRLRTRMARATSAPPTIARLAGSGKLVLAPLATIVCAATIPHARIVTANSRNMRRDKPRKPFTTPEFRLRLMHAQDPTVLEGL